MKIPSRYRVLGDLGVGASGSVYHAEDLRLDREVALKIFSPVPRREWDPAQAGREFMMLARLAIPGVARVLDCGVIESGCAQDGSDALIPFLTRAYVSGRTLHAALDEGLSGNELLHCVAEVAHSLSIVHREGVVHGDIKPNNIILDHDGRPWLIDFGMARLHDEPARHGGGTPAFMAPECLKSGIPTTKGDVYALGAVLWMGLYGQTPLETLSIKARARHMEGQPQLELPPSEKEPWRARAGAIALGALHPDPEKRTAALSEFRSALETLLDTPATTRQEPRVFLPPIPRGRESVVAELELEVSRFFDTYSARPLPGPWVGWIAAGEGMGKTTLLTELRWRMALSGYRVHAAEVTFRGDANGLDMLQDAKVGSQSEAGLVLLIDDLDRAEPEVCERLRAFMYDETRGPVALIGTGRGSNDAWTCHKTFQLEKLARPEMQRLVTDALGEVDESVHEAILRRCDGHPGQAHDLLARAAALFMPSARDIASLVVEGRVRKRADALFEHLGPEARQMAMVLSMLGDMMPLEFFEACKRSSEPLLSVWDVEQAVAELERHQMIERSRAQVRLISPELGEVALRAFDAPARRACALSLLKHVEAFTISQRAELALASEDAAAMARHVPVACDQVLAEGATSRAAKWYAAWLPHMRHTGRPMALLRLARLYLELGEYDMAVERTADVLSGKPSDEEGQEAQLLRARIRIAKGDYALALKELDALEPMLTAERKAPFARERARALLNQGRYPEVVETVSQALLNHDTDDASGIELLTAAGMAQDYQGEQEEADASYRRALLLARRLGRKSEEANVLNYMAIAQHRRGHFREARRLYGESLTLARALEDVGSIAVFSLNVGTLESLQARYTEAERHYLSAISSARRAAKHSSDLMARANLAHLKICLGRYGQARMLLAEVLQDAVRMGIQRVYAQGVALMGDIQVRTHQHAEGLQSYQEAIEIFQVLGQTREVAEAQLDAAEASLGYQVPPDTARADAFLIAASKELEKGDLADLRSRLSMLMGLRDAQLGKHDSATQLAHMALEESDRRGDRELSWRALAVLAHSEAARPNDKHVYLNRTVALIADIASALPVDYQDTYWTDPWRARLNAAYAATRLPAVETEAAMETIAQERFNHLLDILRRLVSEHQLDRLLERITDGAVSFFRAEKGFVLLADATGTLQTHTARGFGTSSDETMSRSIAEAVFIDNDPIVTTDAAGDQRLSEYRSVHKLMLRSVACVPIRGTSGVLGVLYLEHRFVRGRFQDADLDLLLAFADQAALAIEKARMLEQLQLRTSELERANRRLADAHEAQARALERRTEELVVVRRELKGAKEKLHEQPDRYGIVAHSESMRQVLERVERVATSNVPVSIYGESGTGKELIARALHDAAGDDSRPFIGVNCAAIAEGLLESELFGHVKGAFTGAGRDRIGLLAQASGGTLFLDEVANMSPRMQASLLRVLQNGTYCAVGSEQEAQAVVRIVTACHRPLSLLVEEGLFREDLFYRLNVVEIALPPLRDRPGDIPPLCEHFLRKHAAGQAEKKKRLSRGALDSLCAFDWPGNVRQLEHVLLNACIFAQDDLIEAKDLPIHSVQARSAPKPNLASGIPFDAQAFGAQEKERMLQALHSHQWNRAAAARALNMPRRTFYRRLKSHGI